MSKESELHHSIGSLIDGAHPGPKTDRDYLGHYCPKTYETAKGKKEKWCRRELNPGLPRLKPEALHLSGSLFCDEAQILSKSCDILCLVFPHYISCLLQVVIVLEFLHKGDLRHFLLSLTPEYVNRLLHMCITN